MIYANETQLSSDALMLQRQLEGTINQSISPEVSTLLLLLWQQLQYNLYRLQLFVIKVKTTKGMCDKLYKALYAYTHQGEKKVSRFN